MPISIVGDGSITGLTAGGLPDASVVDLDLATGISSSKLTGVLPALDGSSLTGVGVDGIVSTANATAITIQSDEKVRISNDPTATEADGSILTINHRNATNTLPLVILGGANSLTPVNTYLGLGFGYGSATGYVSSGVLAEFKDTGGRMDIHLCAKASGAGNVTLSDSKLAVTSDGRGLSQFTAKLWITFNGITPAILDSHNVSSLTDNAVGDYYVNWSNAPGNTYYSVVGATGPTSSGSGGDSFLSLHRNNASGVPDMPTTSRFRVNTDANAHQNTDLQQVHLVVFGD